MNEIVENLMSFLDQVQPTGGRRSAWRNWSGRTWWYWT
jgi:hypothetical protein